MNDHEVLKNVLKETVETMDIWNAWDKDVLSTVANEKTIHSSIDLKQTLNSKEALTDLARRVKKDRKQHEKELKEEYEKLEFERKGLAFKIEPKKESS